MKILSDFYNNEGVVILPNRIICGCQNFTPDRIVEDRLKSMGGELVNGIQK